MYVSTRTLYIAEPVYIGSLEYLYVYLAEQVIFETSLQLVRAALEFSFEGILLQRAKCQRLGPVLDTLGSASASASERSTPTLCRVSMITDG